MSEITYGKHVIDTTKLPANSLEALIRRGVTHFLGNEQASKVTSWIEGKIELPEGASNDARKAAIKTYRETHADAVAAQTEAVQADAVKALHEGTIGVRASSGPKLTPVETLVSRAAKEEVKETLKALGLSVPKGEEKVSFANGQAFTLDELVERRVAKHGDRLRKAAEKDIADKARNAKKAAEAGLADLID